ncbi:nitroreductase family protein [Streptomyces longispororuber]|uniref:nitroreductase family protein n=1 Tax=Streptomyces longispororuber TaxID=68230 RepID=UPI0033C12A25
MTDDGRRGDALSPEEFARIVRGRSAVRSYAPALIEDRVLDDLLDAMLSAPTGSNAQAWSFVVVRDAAALRRLRAFSPGLVGKPPVVVVACVDGSRLDLASHDGAPELCVTMAVNTLLLTAHAYGLGACPVTSFRTGVLRVLLDMPDHIEPVFMVPMGYPAGERQMSKRRPRSEVISYDLFGQHTPLAGA